MSLDLDEKEHKSLKLTCRRSWNLKTTNSDVNAPYGRKSENSVKKETFVTSKGLINSYSVKVSVFQSVIITFSKEQKKQGAVIVFVVDVAFLFTIVL